MNPEDVLGDDFGLEMLLSKLQAVVRCICRRINCGSGQNTGGQLVMTQGVVPALHPDDAGAGGTRDITISMRLIMGRKEGSP